MALSDLAEAAFQYEYVYKIFTSKSVWNRVGVTYERVVIKIRLELAGGVVHATESSNTKTNK